MQVIRKAFRLCVAPGELERTIVFYETIQRTSCERRIKLDQAGIEVAIVGECILLAGSAEALAPVRDAQAVFMVDSLDESASWLRANGAVILHEPREAPGGRNLTACHPDGLVVEYYEAHKSA